MQEIADVVFNITSVHLRVLEPTKNVIPFQDATMGPFSTFGLALITLEDEDGVVGESPVNGGYANILENCLLPILLHSNGLPYKELYHRLYWSIRNEGFRGPASALVGQIDFALHDLAARKMAVPLHTYLGGSRRDVKIYGSGGGTNYSLQELEAEVGLFLERGVDCYKMKVGKDFGTKLAEDVERVKFVRRLLGRDIKLAVDANQIWSCEQALRFIDHTATEDLAWLEEPLHSADYEQIGRLCKESPLAISYGESERSALVFPNLVSLGVRHLQPIPTQLAGIREWMEVRDLAAGAGLDFSSGGYSLYTSSLMAAVGGDFPVEYLYDILSGLEVYFEVRPQWENGCFVLPDIEGIPVRINWEHCMKENKVIKAQTWTRKNTREYRPTVSL
jgi:L-alanine-DL-glutamate epimerase-like enolase superfamily enzyme